MSITPLRDILVRFRTWLFARDPERRLPWLTLLEISFVLLWAVWVGRQYLDFSSLEWPNGHEFGMAIQPHYIWTLLRRCGDCILWNGLYNGGSPGFVDLHSAVLHPLVIVSTIIWGGLNGTKVALIGSLAMAGLGQWWLGRVMRLGFVSRLWGAMLVITGGHLAGRMEIGVVGVVISTAACSLALAPALKLAFTGHRRDAVVLGFILALAIVSGQGYLQLGFAFAILPALAIFWVDDRLRLGSVWKEFVWAGVLALLLAGPLLIPLGHFWPEFGKEIDPEFKSAQPIQYIPLNFVINDVDFYLNSNLDKQPHPYLYFNYIGWTPILLGIVPLVRARKSQRKQLLFLLLSLFFLILTSGALPFKWLARLLPDFANSIRNPSLIQGLAVPIIVALAAWGVDLILKRGWPLVKLAVSGKQSHKRLLVSLTWVFMLLILFRSLESTYEFSFSWLHVDHNDDIVRQQVLDDVRTSGTQWIALPFGEHFWGPLAAERQLKLTDHVRPSHWKFRTFPLPFLKATRWEVDDEQAEFVNQHADISVVKFPANQYASIQTTDETVPCLAQTEGGHIAVTCQSEQPGQLIVYENMWTGWTASRDGDPIPLLGEQWLTVEAPPGLHHYQFRYKPWDVPVGLGLMVVGLLLAIWMGLGYKLPGDRELIPEPTEQLMDERADEHEPPVVPEEDNLEGDSLSPNDTLTQSITTSRSEIFTALRQMAQTLSLAWDLDTTLDLIARKTADLMQADSCTIYLLDPDQETLRLRASTGLAHRAVGRATLKVGEGMTGHSVEVGRPIFALDAQHDPHFKRVDEAEELDFQSLLAVPLMIEERPIGAMNVQTLKPHYFVNEEVEILSLIGDLAAGALAKAQLYDKQKQQIEEMQALAQVSEAITSPQYLDDMLHVVTDMAARTLGAAVCSIFLLDETGTQLELRSARRTTSPYRHRQPLALGQGAIGYVAQVGEPLYIPDVRSDARYLGGDLAREEGLVSLLAVPLSVRDRVIGVLTCYTAVLHTFTPEQERLLLTLANQTALAIENVRLVTNTAIVREMHHRIKNNLQTVAMLMQLQLPDAERLDTREVLQTNIHRIRSIASVHEVLSEQGFRLVDVKDVLARVMGMTAVSPMTDTSVHVYGEPVLLPSREATSLTLVVNELVQNALEHAQAHQVAVSFGHSAAEIIVLVKDDGIGLPVEFEQGLGLEIAETLVREDLNGRLKFNRLAKGTEVSLRMPKEIGDWRMETSVGIQ